MIKYFEFYGDDNWSRPSSWCDQEVPSHTQESLANYLMHGYAPGGFVTSVLTNDLHGAVIKADPTNKPNLIAITNWVLTNVPEIARGTDERIRAWVTDQDHRRSQYADAIMKAYTWRALHG